MNDPAQASEGQRRRREQAERDPQRCEARRPVGRAGTARLDLQFLPIPLAIFEAHTAPSPRGRRSSHGSIVHAQSGLGRDDHRGALDTLRLGRPSPVEANRRHLRARVETQAFQALLLERRAGLPEPTKGLVHVPAGGGQVDRDLAGIGSIQEALRVAQVIGEQRGREAVLESLTAATASWNEALVQLQRAKPKRIANHADR